MNDRAASPLVPLLVDSHCHLDLDQFDEDRGEVLARASERGVRIIVNPGIDLQHCQQAISLAERYEPVYAAVGIHPNSADTFDESTPAQLRRLAAHPKVVAIGEIGLDYYWDRVDPAQQMQAFQAQLTLAADLGLPVMIHNRDASDDVAAALDTWTQQETTRSSPLARRTFWGVLHAFGGDLDLAQRAYDWNFVLGLGGPLTFKNARDLHALVPRLRLDRLMIETDAPYLTPHPHRGKRNEPGYVALVAEKMAVLLDQPFSVIAQRTSQVALAFFGLHEQFAGEMRDEDQFQKLQD